jgi:leucyl/phenylalanyl-tRNA---protein transferase
MVGRMGGGRPWIIDAPGTPLQCAPPIELRAWQNRRVIPWLRRNMPFPPIENALTDPNGLLAVSDDVTPGRLLDAYRHGIFPWYSGDQPVLWWSPDPRMVLFVDEFHVARSLRKRVKQQRWDIRADTAFRTVMQACARTSRPRQMGTWITPALVDAYTALHAQGHAHSVEAWSGDTLVGGLYGVAIGRMFFGESMFAKEPDASKVAFVHLIATLRARGFPLVDCQQETAHLASFGARPIRRREFAERVAALVHSDAPDGPWGLAPAMHGFA